MNSVGYPVMETAHLISSDSIHVPSVLLYGHLRSANCCISTVLKPSKGVSPITRRSVRGPNIFSCRICVSLICHECQSLLALRVFRDSRHNEYSH